MAAALNLGGTILVCRRTRQHCAAWSSARGGSAERMGTASSGTAASTSSKHVAAGGLGSAIAS